MHIRVEDRNDVRTVITSVAERLGHIDFLIINAGIDRDRTLVKMTPEEWDEVIGVDLTGVFNVIHEVVSQGSFEPLEVRWWSGQLLLAPSSWQLAPVLPPQRILYLPRQPTPRSVRAPA